MRRRSVGLLAAALVVALAGCAGNSGKNSGEDADSPADPSKVSGEITVLTHRTDMVTDGTMDNYAAEFNKIYPKVKVKFEGITSYENEVKIRMNTDNYGDVLFIPSVVKRSDYPNFFASLGTVEEMSKKYRYTSFNDYEGKSYGLTPNGNAVGFVYNKKVWAQAGIAKWATTPEEFLAALKLIDEKTDAVPLYTNYHDGWPLSQWQAAIGNVTCDVEANDKLATTSAPWTQGNDMYTIDSLLYNVTKEKLIESDPTTTNWENSKGMLATGKIGVMWLGSWAVIQMQQAATKAGADPADIGFMPFPAQKDGAYCAVNAPDYQQAVSIHSEHKAAARAWVDWFADTSTYAKDSGSISVSKDSQMPSTLQEFGDQGVTLIELTQEQAVKVNEINDESEIGLNSPEYRQKIVDAGRGADKDSLESIFADLNKRWDTAMKTVG